MILHLQLHLYLDLNVHLQPLEGGVIREEALEEAKGQSLVSADFLGISTVATLLYLPSFSFR